MSFIVPEVEENASISQDEAIDLNAAGPEEETSQVEENIPEEPEENSVSDEVM